MTQPNNETAIKVLQIILNQTQYMREEGESDLRSILYTVGKLLRDVKEGKEIVIEEYDE